jgi:hypothetical protein
MRSRSLAVVFAVLAMVMVLFVGQAAFAEDKTHEGKIVKTEENKLTMTDMEGNNKNTHDVATDAVIMLDGKECKLAELKEGQFIKVTTKSNDQGKTWVTRIEARLKA